MSSLLSFSADIPLAASVIIDCRHDPIIVVLACIIGTLSAASYLTALNSIRRSRSVWGFWRWIAFGGIVLGGGIWATHFIAMEAFDAAITISYGIGQTLLSLVLVMFFCSLSLLIFGLGRELKNKLLSGVVLAVGVLLMHYMGMSAMIMPAHIYYHELAFSVSILVALVSCSGAMFIADAMLNAERGRLASYRIGFSLFLGACIAGIHFTGMEALILVNAEFPSENVAMVTTGYGFLLSLLLITVLVLVMLIWVGAMSSRLILKEQHLETVSDLLTQLSTAQQSLQQIAFTDALTKVQNRHSIAAAVQRLIDNYPSSGQGFYLFFMDLDRFKAVNDSMGHGGGDRLLTVVASRICECVRADDFVGRIGGDEFVVVLRTEDRVQVERAADRIGRRLAEKVHLLEGYVEVTASIGISQFPHDGDSVDSLLTHADAALYAAKQAGRNNRMFFNPTMREHVNDRNRLEGLMQRALDNDEFSMVYQPIIDLKTRKIASVEALIRWNCDGEFISPMVFIPVAESCGLIRKIGQFVIDQSLKDFAVLAAYIPEASVSVNLSPRQFLDTELVGFISSRLSQYKLRGQQLCLEVTEGCIVENLDSAITQLENLKQLGIRISIDDFGTGYSSLAYLKRLPIDNIKIDKVFADSLPDDQEDKAINEAILAMARKLNLSVVAEGVESIAQLEFYMENHCDYVQGYYFYRPLSFVATKALFIDVAENGYSPSFAHVPRHNVKAAR